VYLFTRSFRFGVSYFYMVLPHGGRS